MSALTEALAVTASTTAYASQSNIIPSSDSESDTSHSQACDFAQKVLMKRKKLNMTNS
jgi:hypothetical protein